MESPTRDPSTCLLTRRITSTLPPSCTANSVESDPNKASGLDFSKYSKDFSRLVRHYLSGTRISPDLLSSAVFDDKSAHLLAIDVISNDVIMGNYPVRKSFRRSFLKQLIQYLETSSLDVSDELYSAVADCMMDADEFSYRTYLSPCGSSVRCTIEESNQQLSHGTTGLSVWQASCDLANLMTSFFDLSGKTVMELGAGCGLTGLAIATSFPTSSVTLSDYDPKVLERLEKNVRINCGEDCCSRVTVSNIDWSTFDLDQVPVIPDVVVAADVVYDRMLLPSLCRTIQMLISKGGVAYVASTLRDPDTLRAFREAIAASGLTISCEVRYQHGSFSSPSTPSSLSYDVILRAPTLFPFYSTLDTPTVIYQLTVAS